MCRWVCLAPLPPTGKRGKEGFNTRIGGMSVQLGAGEQALQMFLLEPKALMPHGPPEEDERLALEQATFMRQLI